MKITGLGNATPLRDCLCFQIEGGGLAAESELAAELCDT